MHLFLTSGETCGQLSDYGDHLNTFTSRCLWGLRRSYQHEVNFPSASLPLLPVSTFAGWA